MNEGFYSNYLSQHLGEDVEVKAGGSGYFSAPSAELDPHLFDGDDLKQDVLYTICDPFLHYWVNKYPGSAWLIKLWLAGSGISYQWSADRGNGDLDVMIGIDWDAFHEALPAYQGIPETDMADMVNADLKTHLWPKTAETEINGQTYEVTYYLNPHSQDIRDIHPYAAYEIFPGKEWVIKPPVLPESPEGLYDKSWFEQIDRETKQAKDIVDRFDALRRTVGTQQPSSAMWTNTLAQISNTVDQARSMFDDIHLGRKKAFADGGEGYGDWNNFRWQAHKRAGTVQALNQIAAHRKESRAAMEAEVYGGAIKDAHAALTEAALYNKHLRGMP